jgi:hypothetical protein
VGVKETYPWIWKMELVDSWIPECCCENNTRFHGGGFLETNSVQRFPYKQIFSKSFLGYEEATTIFHAAINSWQYDEMIDSIKDNSDNVTVTDAFLVPFGDGMIDHITFHTNLYGQQQGKPFKPVIRMK